MRMEKMITRFPCGGRLEIRCSHVMDFRAATGKGHINVILIPEIYCARGYVPGNGCPWLHMLWKFNDGISRRQHEGRIDADSVPIRQDEAKVLNADGTMTYVLNSKVGHGLVIRGFEVFQDPNFGAVAADKVPYEFDCCNDVKTRHGGIIAFFRRLLGRRK